jgi:glycosyltransferase involved in cell wall biosynthesis
MKVAPKALRVLDIEDLHFVRHARHAHYKKCGYQPSKPAYLQPKAILDKEHAPLLLNEATSREMACIYRSDLIITLSAFEQELLTNTFHIAQKNIVHIPYLLEQTNIEAHQVRKDFVSIGNFRHAPNIDAVNVLIQHLWPAIAKRLPDAKCHIYGAYLPPRIQNLHNPKNRLFIQGHVQDHHQMLSQAKVLLAPIQFGAGVKGKIVDAMRCGLPSITTPIGAEGLEFTTWPGAIVTEREDFIQKAVEIYESEHDYLPETSSVLEQNFHAHDHKARLINTIEQALAERDENRQQNFLQQMVCHHSLQTHQYMSQWIAAKNKHSEED